LIAYDLTSPLNNADERQEIVVEEVVLGLKVLQKQVLEPLQAESVKLTGLHIKYERKKSIDATIYARDVAAHVFDAIRVIEIHRCGGVFGG
jgi:hypothetical protein